MTASYRFRVLGRVQGVCFRQSTCTQAQALQLHGWVRNCSDGSVEGLACGEPAALLALQRWLQQGPPAARVEQLDWRPSDESAGFGFLIRD